MGAGYTSVLTGANGCDPTHAARGCGEYQTGLGSATTVQFSLSPSVAWVESAISFPPPTPVLVANYNHTYDCNAVNCGLGFNINPPQPRGHPGRYPGLRNGWTGVAPPSTPTDTFGDTFTLAVSNSVTGALLSLLPSHDRNFNSNQATQYPVESKVFFANGLYWTFYEDGSNTVFRTSSNGASWSSATTVRAGNIGYDFSVDVDTAINKVYYVWASEGATFAHRAGTLNSGGTITGTIPRCRSPPRNGTNTDPTITKDTNGNPVDSDEHAPHYLPAGNYVEVWKCTISGRTAAPRQTGPTALTSWRPPRPLGRSRPDNQRVEPPASCRSSNGKGVLEHMGGSPGDQDILWKTWSSERTTTSSLDNGGTSAISIGDTTYLPD